jgi:S1-C subfamily serine protease
MSTMSGGSHDQPGPPIPEPTREVPIDPTVGLPVYWGPPSSSASAPDPSSSPPPLPSPPSPPLPPYPGVGAPGSWGLPPTPPEPPSTPSRRPSYRGVVAAALALTLAAGSLGAGIGVALAHRHNSSSVTDASSALPGVGNSPNTSPSTPNTNPNSPSTTPNTVRPNSGSSGSSSPSTSAIASKVDPAVVDVTSTLAFQNGTAAGTGMVITSSGEVLTNNHVVEGASKITVQIDGKGPSYPAKVLGTDKTDDVALLQMQGVSGLKTVQLGDSSKVAIGDAVVAIGNALNLPGPPSVAQGSVTALDQSIQVSGNDGSTENLSGLIQTDAQLQQGDSGGPLVNASGQVIGMDTAASVGRRFSSGPATGFAIPINRAKAIADQIAAGQASGNVHIGEAAFLGVEVQPASGNGSGSSSGAVVSGVAPNTPAQTAGLAAGDTIVAFDGKAVNSPSDLTQLISGHHPGDRVQVGWVDQSGQHHSATVRLMSGPPA